MTVIMTDMTLRRSIRCLFAASLGAMALISLAAAPTAAATEDESFFTHLHTDKAMANVTVSPGRAGPVEITIQLETTDERPLSARSVSVTLSDMESGRRLRPVDAARGGDDDWHVRVSMLTPGRWMLGLGIAISEGDHVSVESPILIK